MNQQLIKLIELCLIDGVISDKERSVIFKKSEELGISKDECEIILEGMIQKHSKKNTSQPQKKKGFFGSIMDEVKKNIDVDSITDKVKSIQEEYEKKVEEVTNQNQPKTISSSKTSKPKSTTPKKVSKPKPTPSKPKKTITKSSTIESKKSKSKEKEEIEKDSLLTISFFSEFHFKKNGDNTSFDEGQLIQLEHEKWVVKEKELLIYKIKDYKNYITLCEPDRYLDYSFYGWDSIKENNKKVFECSKELIEILENLSVEKFELNNNILLEDLIFEGQISIEKNNRDIVQFRYRDKEKLSDEEKEMFFIIPSQNVFLHTGLKLINIDNSSKNNPFINFVSSISFKYGSDYKTTLTSLKKLKVIIEKGGDYFRKIETTKNEINHELTEYKTNKEELILNYNLYYNILKNNQSKINEIDREYVQKFIKLNNYLKQKSSNLSTILEKTISNLENEPKETIIEREQEINFFKGLVYSYNLMVNHSIVMVTSLVEDDTITFYEIYEEFDKINVFNTNWENEVNDKLSEINESLHDLNFSIKGLMNQMRGMEKKLVTQLNTINTSIGSLENSVNKQLSETNSRLKYQNLTSYYSKSTLKGSWDWFDGP